MTQYQYILQPYSGRESRYRCPDCGKPQQFTKYISAENGQALSDVVGKCNRLDRCAYHLTPKQYFEQNGAVVTFERHKAKITRSQFKPRPISYIDDNAFRKSLDRYEQNKLVKYLNTIYSPEKVLDLINTYKIGTSSRYGGGTTVFWQIDYTGRVRTGKLIKYDKNGHRIKGCNNWVHSVLDISNFNLKQCLFGEHLLKHSPYDKVAIVESEKTAVIMAGVMPNLVWLASGGAEGLNEDKVRILEGREVILFPDTSWNGLIYKKWKLKAKQFGFEISDYLENYANNEQKSRGLDIADFLISSYINIKGH